MGKLPPTRQTWFEILTAIVIEHGGTVDSIIDVARRKRAERGGFDVRLRLDSVDSASP